MFSIPEEMVNYIYEQKDLQSEKHNISKDNFVLQFNLQWDITGKVLASTYDPESYEPPEWFKGS